jgi:hypothetical protein
MKLDNEITLVFHANATADVTFPKNVTSGYSILNIENNIRFFLKKFSETFLKVKRFLYPM